MLSLQKCKEVLVDDGASFTDDEIKAVRDLLYQLAHIEYENYLTLKNDQEQDKSNTIRKGFDRRTKRTRV